MIRSELPQVTEGCNYFSNVGKRNRNESTNSKSIDKFAPEKDSRVCGYDFKCNTDDREQKANSIGQLASNLVSYPACSERAKDCTVGRLVSRWESYPFERL